MVGRSVSLERRNRHFSQYGNFTELKDITAPISPGGIQKRKQGNKASTRLICPNK